jgi:glycosyltransferase involved in cell wall biosynthesis
MRKNFISVVIPAHNEESVIAKAITSVLDSTYKNFEIIVVNDGSTDKTKKITQNLIKNNSKKIKLLDYYRGHSPAFARNRGAEAAKGDILFFLDADDWMRKDTLENIKNSFNKFTGIEFIIGIREPVIPNNWRKIFYYYWARMGESVIKNEGIEINTPNCPYIMKTSSFFRLGKFNENLFYNEDNDFRIRLIKKEIPKLLTNDIHFYTDMGDSKKDFLKRCKNTAKYSSKNISNLIRILITLSISIMTFPVFYLAVFSYMSIKSHDLLISTTTPFLYFLRRILDVYFIFKLNLNFYKTNSQ